MTAIKHPSNGALYDAPADVLDVYLDNGWVLDDGKRVSMGTCQNPDCSARYAKVVMVLHESGCPECGKELLAVDEVAEPVKKALPGSLGAGPSRNSD